MKCTQGQRQGAREREGVPSNPSRRRLRKGLWSPDEDDKLTNYITRNGLGGCWNYVAKQSDLQRCGKSCRLRWINYLRPGLKRGAFSRQEERLIINLQSNLGNRWSQIAAHLPGRTDNEVKNYWNSSIKKRLMAKHDRASSSTAPANGDTNRKSNFTLQSTPSCNPNSMRPAADNVLDVVTSSHTAEPYLEVMPAEEGHKPAHNSAFNILLTARENQLCAPGILELKPEQAQDQNDEFLIDPDPTNINQLICYSKLLFNANSSHANDSFSNHTSLISPSLQAQGLHKAAKPSACRGSTLESVPPHKLHGSSNNYSLGSTGISVPALVESQSFIGKIENDGQINENQIMIDYSSFTASTGISAWSFGGHSSSNIAADFTDVYSGVSYSNELLGIAILEDLVTVDHEKTANQSCPPLNSVAAPPISWANNLDAADDRKDRLNLRYDEVLKYTEINSSRQKSYQIEGGGRIADQLADCSRIFNQEAKAKPIPAVLGGAGSAPLEIHECKGGAGQVAVWAQDDMYNIHTAAASDFFDQIYFS